MLSGQVKGNHATETTHMTEEQVTALAKRLSTRLPAVQKYSGPKDPPAYTRMIADPLKAPVVGRPDENAYRTNAFRFPDTYSVTGTQTAMLFGASASAGAYTAPTITAGAVTSWGTSADSFHHTGISADYVIVRPLIYVVQWLPTFSSTTGSGRIYLGTYQGTSVTNGVTMGPLTGYFDDPGYVGPADKPAVIIVRATHNGPMLVNGNNFSAYFPTTLAVFTGLPAGDCGQIIVTRIYEGAPYGGNLASMKASHTPCDMMDCCCASNIVGDEVTGKTGVDDPYESVKSKALKLALAAAKDAATWGLGGFMPNVAKMLM